MRQIERVRFFGTAAAYLVVAHLAAPAWTQGFVTLTATQFDLEASGARSLAAGGAFAAVAGDLTAAFANPAGLIDLDGSEVRLEVRYADLEQESPEFRAEASFSDSVVDPSFAGFGRARERFAFGVYACRQSLETHYSARFSFSAPGGRATNTKTDSDFNLELSEIAAASALRLGPRMSAGVTLRHLSADLDSLGVRSSRTNSFLVESTEAVADSDSAVVVDIGLLVRPSERWSIGLAWSAGERFELEQAIERSVGGFPSDQVFIGELAVPETVRLGVAVRVASWASIAAEVSRVATGDWSRERSLLAGNEETRDVTRYHLGARFEHAAGDQRLVWSLGLRTDPDHDGNFFADSEQLIASAGLGLELASGLRLDLAVAAGDVVFESIAALGYRW